MRTTDPVIRKLQEKDPEFPKYDGNPEHFQAWFVAVEERTELRQLSDQAAIIFATEALEGHARGTAGDGKRFENWRAFVKELKSKFCPQTVEYNVLHTLQSLRVQGGNFHFYVNQYASQGGWGPRRGRVTGGSGLARARPHVKDSL